MKLRDIIATAGANLMRAKLRTSLTIVAIFIGAFTLTITTGIGAGIADYVNTQLNNLGASNVLIIQPAASSDFSGPGSAPQKYNPSQTKRTSAGGLSTNQSALSQADLTKISDTPGITHVAPLLGVSVDYVEGPSAGQYQLGVSPDVPGTKLDLAAGSGVNDNSTGYQIVLPSSYVSVLGFASDTQAIGQTITLGLSNAYGQAVTQTAQIVGIQKAGIVGSDDATTNSVLTVQLYNLQTQGLPSAAKDKYVAATATFNSDLSTKAVAELKNTLKNDGYTALTIQDRIGTFETVIEAIVDVLDAFAVIALLAAGFGIINTLLMAVQERTKEIGLMKSMGMRSGRIFLLFSTEAVLIGFWGSLLGVGIAFIVGRLADHILSRGILKGLPGLTIVAFPISGVISIMLIIMAIAFLAGTLPARRAARQNPIDALRYE